MGCCCNKGEESTTPERYEEDRSCTDHLFCLLFVAFWGAFIFIAVTAFKSGDPYDLLFGTDYLGYRCGGDAVPSGFASVQSTLATSTWQSSTWTNNQFLFYPMQSVVAVNLFDIINTGICVESCPVINSADVSAIEASMDPSTWSASVLSDVTVYTYGAVTADGVTEYTPAQRYATYSSVSFLRRCIPSGLSASNIASLQSIPYASSATSFITRGVTETAASWRVFLIMFFVCIALCLLFTLLMRYFLKVIVWTCLILLFGVLAVAGFMCWNRYTNLNNDANTTNQSNQYVKFYFVAAIVAWAVSLVYLIVLIALRTHINIACGVIQISGRVIGSSPIIMVVPFIVAIAILAVGAWCFAVAIFTYAVQGTEYTTLDLAVYSSTTTATGSATFITISGQVFAEYTGRATTYSTTSKNYIYYDLFGFLWTMGILNAIGFMTIAFVTVFWYFSDLDDDRKAVPVGGMCRGFWWTLRYHLGTVAFGSFLIAVVQFVRIMFNYFYNKAKGVDQNAASKLILCCVNCVLQCFERILEVISQNAYVMTCITSSGFLCSACAAISLLLDNIVLVVLLSWIVAAVLFLGKALITVGCVLIAYLLMNDSSLDPGVETRIVPLIFIGIGSFVMASVFFNVFHSTVDANFLCYCHDKKVNQSKAMYYAPKELAQYIDGYDQEYRLQQYQKAQQDPASSHPAEQS